jgi:plastocyanin
MHTLALAVAAFLIPSTAAPAPQSVQTVALYSYGYAPPAIHLAAGKPVTLNFVNRSGNGHDFTARSFFAKSRILAGSASNGEIDLDPGQTRSVTLIPVAGRYKVHCGHFFHKQMGMRGTIVVD